MADQQSTSLEKKLGELLEEANKINDQTVRNKVLAEIEKLRKEKTQKNEPQQRNTPKREVIIRIEAPNDLTAKYDFIGWYTMHSDVYSTDDKPPFFWGQRWDELYKSGGSYEGYAANYIKSSLEKIIKEHAETINADLVIVQFTTERPFKFRVYKVSGLGKYNYVGEISAKFYARK